MSISIGQISHIFALFLIPALSVSETAKSQDSVSGETALDCKIPIERKARVVVAGAKICQAD